MDFTFLLSNTGPLVVLEAILSPMPPTIYPFGIVKTPNFFLLSYCIIYHQQNAK